jgi:hypothetical protein
VSETYWRGADEDEAMQEEHVFLWRALLDTASTAGIDLAGRRVLDAGCNRGGFLRLLVDDARIAEGRGYDPAAWPDVEVVGVTTNLEVDGQRAGCAQHDLRLAGRGDVPVAAGASSTLTGGRYVPTWGDDRYWPTPVTPGAALDRPRPRCRDGRAGRQARVFGR